MKHDLKVNFLCSHCRAYLRVWNNIIFIVNSIQRKLHAILLLNPELGNYNLVHHSSVEFEEGEMLNFMCPVCRTDHTKHPALFSRQKMNVKIICAFCSETCDFAAGIHVPSQNTVPFLKDEGTS